MYSIRKTLLALAMLALAAFVTPAVAAAEEWTVEGKDLGTSMLPVFTDEGFPIKEGAGNVGIQGPILFQGVKGGIECTLNASATLGVNSGEGSITEASISPESCDASGALNPCTVTSATVKQLPWVLAADSTGIATGLQIVFKLTGGFFCLTKEDTVTGAYLITPDNVKAMSSWTLSGEVESYYQHGSKEYKTEFVTVSGELDLTPAGRYGIDETVAVGLSGAVQWTTAMKGVECSVTADQALTVGGTGRIKSFKSVSCSKFGSWFCNVDGLTQNNQYWPIQNEGTKVKLEGVKFLIEQSGAGNCNDLQVEGTLDATPAAGEISAIKKVAISGTPKVFQGGNEYGGSWLGELNWSPAGVYGL